MSIQITFLGGTTLFQTTTTFRRCTVATAVLVAVGSTALGLGTTAAVADTAPTGTSTAASTSADAATTAGGTTSTATPTTDVPNDRTPADSAATSGASATPAPADTAATGTAPTDTLPTDTAPTDAAPTDPSAPADQPAAGQSTATPSADTTPAAAAAATPAGAVSVGGTVMRWHTLTADTSGWPEGTTFTYQWQSSFDGGDAVDVAGATASTMTISPLLGDLDQLRVVVTGTAPGQEPTSVTSALTGPVAENPDMRWGFLGTQTVRASVDTRFSQSLAAFDGDGLQYYVNDGFEGPADDSVLPDGVTFAPDGTLSGTPTTPGIYDFWLHTSTGLHPNGSEASRVELLVRSGTAVDMAVVVRGELTSTGWPSWVVHPDGSVTYSDSTEVQSGDPTIPIRVRQDESLELSALGFDRRDNVAELADLTWSSSVAGDTFTPTDSTNTVTLRFAHASPHVITARSGSLTQTFTVQVDPVSAAATVSSTTPRTPTGQLAFTGTDPSAPLAWALGLLAAGAALVVARVRRRRA